MTHPTAAIILLAGIFAAASPAHGQAQGADTVVDWLRAQAHPLRSLEPDGVATDLQPLKSALAGVSVVGLGESMHGARELFRLKHRLVQFLVAEMGFTTLAMETESSDAEALNEYVLHGTGDLATALTGQGLTCWDTEEIAAMFRWMREHNRRVPDARKVQFVGLDIVFHTRGRARVLDYVRRRAPDRAAGTEALFRVLAEQQALWPWRFQREVIAGSIGQVEALHDFLVAERARLEPAGAARELDAPIRDMRRMVQHALAFLPSSDPRWTGRSRAMGLNLAELLEREPERKFIVWAFDSHVSVGSVVNAANLGSALRDAIGPSYYALALQVGRGSTQIRRGNADATLGPFEVVETTPAPPGTLPWYLSQVGRGNAFVNLRAPRTPAVEAWLARPIGLRAVGWAFKAGELTTMVDGTVGRYDGLIYVEQTDRARPTRNARKRVAKGAGF
jgi:erythromycin esterase